MNEPFKRSSGILLHPTSLPGAFGIGDLGPIAYQFLDFLFDSGQTWWQMLPVNPPGYGESPYNTISAFAGNPLLISLEKLVEQGLLNSHDLKQWQIENVGGADFGAARSNKQKAFRKAFAAFKDQSSFAGFESFCECEKEWLEDYSCFEAIKEKQGGKSWVDWPRGLRRRNISDLEKTSHQLKDEILYHKFLQYQFNLQWHELKNAAQKKGIKLMGDVPIFVAHDSAEVWKNPKLFKLRQNGFPSVVAGVPPDYFSKTGQLWGNPVYRWSIHKKTGFQWWTSRLRRAFELFDGLRLDHFIGFYRAWEIPYGSSTAEHGKWVLGPRGAFFQKILQELGPVSFVAEDLGHVIPPVTRLRKKFKLPGMVVLHFAFYGGTEAAKLRMKKMKRQTVVYTGTHDNNTSNGWIREIVPPDPDRKTALEIMGTSGPDVHWEIINLALSLKADLAIVPLQDVLGLGVEARMNRPGQTDGNWGWRFSEKDLSASLAQKFHALVKKTKRIPS